MSHTGTCPSCGASLTFEVGSSRVAVCRFCSTLVVRHGQDFESVGKVADVMSTGSRLALGATGQYVGQRFTIIGRLQLEWVQGVWDEWYVSFPDGRWGWLAEAGGRYYLTFGVHTPGSSALPARHTIAPGHDLQIDGHGRFVVSDIKEAHVVSASGELPEEIALEGAVYSADLEGPQGVFATIDYGGRGDHPELFVGKQLTLAELDLQLGSGVVLPDAGPEGHAITCHNCGAPITIRVPGQTVRLVCGSCNALLDAKNDVGRVIDVLERHREEPLIALGRKGTLRGAEVMVVGWMRRTCQVSFVDYDWDELLLYDPRTTALSWLVCSEGHWSLARPISAAEVTSWNGETTYKEKTYRIFSSVVGTVTYVLGEFPWMVQVGESAQLEDYIAPPDGLSLERTTQELNWSFVEHLEAREVAEAFGKDPKEMPRRVRVGTFQPWFLETSFRMMKRWIIGGVAAALALWFFQVQRDNKKIIEHTFVQEDVPSVEPATEGGEAPPPAPGNRLRSYVSEPFDLSGFRALEVRVKSNVDNGWAWVEGALIREETGDASFFGMENAYYHGTDDGEAWSEGEREATHILSSPSRGTYVLRADLQWDTGAYTTPSVTVAIHEDGWSGRQLLVVLGFILSPLLLLLHRRSFEKRRWEDSNLIG